MFALTDRENAMANQRLTNSLRNDVAERVIHDTFDHLESDLEKRESAIANKVLDWHIGEGNLKLMNQLPLEFFGATDRLPVASKDDGVKYLFLKGSRRIPANMQYGLAVDLPGTNGMWREIRAVKSEIAAMNAAKNELREKTMALLNSVQTVKRLVEVWPEVEKYLPKQAEQTENLPAVRAEDLNAMIKKLAKK